MKKSCLGNLPPVVTGTGLKKITSKIDTGRKRVTTGTLLTTTSSTTNVSASTTSSIKSKPTGSASSLKSTSSTGTSTFPRSQKGNQSRPCQPSKDPSVRAFVQANARVSNMTSLFHDEVDTQSISAALVKNARKSGVLNLSGRNLISVPMKVWRINELDENERLTVSVSLDDNSEDKWWEFVDLQKLIIANNYIKNVPCDISNLHSLQTFDAHDNQIITVSKDLGKLTNLSKLDLSHNMLTTLPEELGELKRLVELNLSHNSLEEISACFGNLTSLRTFNISHNNISKFPGDLGFLSFLQTLIMSNNQLTELPEEIGGLSGLRTLDVSFNCLKLCPAGLSELVHLEILYLQRNKLEQMPDVSKAKNLKELYLQNNLIRAVNFEKLSNTKINLLDLRNNKIDDLQLDCEDMEFLDRLYLDNNNLAELPDDLALLPSLKALTLDGNPIRGIRLDILQRGTQEVLKYLRGRLRLSESSERGDTGVDLLPERNIPVNNVVTTNGGSSDLVVPPRPLPSRKSKSPSRRKSGGVSVEELGIDPFKCKASRNLLLSGRQIVNLETNVFQLAADNAVTCIDLSKNMMMTLPSSIELCQEWLVEIKLDFNRLTDVPSSLSKCSRLQYLTLQNNQLSELPADFSHLKSLREINIGYNRFNTFPPCLYQIPSLEIIIMACNKLDKLEPKNLEKLKRLAVLDVRNNNIAIMPAEIGLMTQLKSLSIEGNAFRVPNYQIISQGTDVIMAYLRNRVIQ